MHHVTPNNKDRGNGSKNQTTRIMKNIVDKEIEIKNYRFKEPENKDQRMRLDLRIQPICDIIRSFSFSLNLLIIQYYSIHLSAKMIQDLDMYWQIWVKGMGKYSRWKYLTLKADLHIYKALVEA